jgi:hypothetical protein
MDLEFNSAASRLAKEQAARRREAEARRARDERVRREADEAAARLAAAAEERRRERAAATAAAAAEAEEVASSVHFACSLRAVPWVRADTNRVILPASAFEALERERALERHGGPLTFELAVQDDEAAGGAARTHCGVSEFTAEEGTVGIPPAVALSLARGRGVDWLAGRSVRVRFEALPRVAKASVALQPRGDGFHAEGRDVVNIDIKSVLLRTLRDSLTLSEGDWIPLRHEGRTYELVVRRLEPEPALLLLDTDVEVDLLPSEAVQRAERAAAAAAMALAARHECRGRALAAWRTALHSSRDALRAEPEPAPGEPASLLRVRLPHGATATRRFALGAPLRTVLNWARASLPDGEEPPVEVSDAQLESLDELSLVRAGVPGLRADSLDAAVQAGATLHDSGLRAGARESLMVTWRRAEPEAAPDSGVPPPAERSAGASGPAATLAATATATATAAHDFSAAMQAAEQRLDADLEQSQLRKALEDSLHSDSDKQAAVDKVHVFHTLVAQNVPPQDAARAAQSFAPQIVALESMGLGGQWRRCIELLEKYQGRLDRVVNLLVGAD